MLSIIKFFDLFFSSILMILLAIKFLNKITDYKIKLTLKKEVELILLLSLLSTIIGYFSGIKKTMMLLIVYLILFNKMYNLSKYVSFLFSILFILLLIIPDCIVVLFFNLFLKTKTKFFFIKTSLVFVIFYFLIFLMSKIVKFSKKNLINSNYKFGFSLFIVFLLILFLFYNTFFHLEVNTMFFIKCFIILFLSYLVFLFIYLKYINNLLKIKYDKLLEFIVIYEKEIEEQRIIKHENKNQLLTIKAKIIDNDKKENIIGYIDSLLNEYTNDNYSNYAKFQYLPANGIKGLLYYKLMEALEMNLNVDVNISHKIKNSVLKDLAPDEFKELGRLLGIFIDNAITESNNSLEKKLGLEIYLSNKNVVIIISNTFNNTLCINKMGKERYSTNGSNHGYGLLYAQKILKRNRIFSLNNTIYEKVYIQKIIIKNF